MLDNECSSLFLGFGPAEQKIGSSADFGKVFEFAAMSDLPAVYDRCFAAYQIFSSFQVTQCGHLAVIAIGSIPVRTFCNFHANTRANGA
jgi:hypothetical protein